MQDNSGEVTPNMPEQEYEVRVRVRANSPENAEFKAYQHLSNAGNAHQVVLVADPYAGFTEEQLEEDMSKLQLALSQHGYAIIIWNPRELGDADPSFVEERSIEIGWEHLVQGISPDEIDTLRDYCDDWALQDAKTITQENRDEIMKSLRYQGEDDIAEKLDKLDLADFQKLILKDVYGGGS